MHTVGAAQPLDALGPTIPTVTAFQAGARSGTGWKSAPGFVIACFLPYGFGKKCLASFSHCLKEYLWVCFELGYLDKFQIEQDLFLWQCML